MLENILGAVYLKLSIYRFTDLDRTFGIVEFDNTEYERLEKELLTQSESLLEKMKTLFNGEIKCFKHASGRMFYDGGWHTLHYINIELNDYREYTFEVYPLSMLVIANTNIDDVREMIIGFAKLFVGEKLKIPRGRLIGFF